MADLDYSAYPGDVPMTKKGLGTLVADKSLSAYFVAPLTVAEGVLKSNDDNGYYAFGKRPNSTLKILPGATIRCVGDGFPMLSRGLHVAGEGATGQGGAVVADGLGSGFCQVGSMNYMLDGDTTFYSENSPEGTYLLRNTVFEFRGHTLTLRSSDRGHVVPGESNFRAVGTGAIVVDDSNLIFSTCTFTKDYGAYVSLKLINKAGLFSAMPGGFTLFDVIDAEPGCTLGCRYSTSSADTVEAAVKVLKGAPTVRDAITALSVSDSLTVRVSELKDGHALALSGTLAFGENAKLVVEGALDEMLDAGETVTIATAEGGVTGLPAFQVTSENKHWHVEAGTDGKSVVLCYVSPKPAGAIDARTEWKILPGADQASANVTKFNDAMAACADGAVVFFPAGDYSFDAPLAVGAKNGVTLMGEGSNTLLRATDATAGCVLSATGTTGLALRDIGFADCAGVAVSASSTVRLAVTNCWYEGIGGAVSGQSGTYPIAIANGTDSFVRANQTLDGATYTAHVFLDGGNVLAKSEPDAGLVLCVGEGDTEAFATAFARSGYSTYPTSITLVKVGAGTLVGAKSQLVGERNIMKSINFINIEAGTLSLSSPDDCCPYNGGESIRVSNGATLLIEKRGDNHFLLVSRTITLEGTGAPGRKGALVIGSGASTEGYSSLSFVLDGDATIYNANETGLAAIFRVGIVNTCGYRMRLASASKDSGFRFALGFRTQPGTGVVLADGVSLLDEGEDGSLYFYVRSANSQIALSLANGTVFKPNASKIFDVWKGIEMDATSQMLGRQAGIAATLGDWTGCGTLDANIASLTVTNALTVRASDLKAGHCLTAAGAIAALPGVTVTLEDAASLNALEPGDAPPPFAFATAGTSISGKPRKAPGCDFAGWSVMDGADGRSWTFDHSGLMMLFR